jgi:pimeloyl-ACP methyl ester carboxylesterase
MMAEKILETEEYKIVYQRIGTGKTVILIHGFGEDGRIWDKLLKGIQDQFDWIIPDIPGSGKSILKSGSWSMEKFAEAIRTIMVTENINSSVIIGHSMGGYITLAFGEKYPERLRAFGLFHSSAFADNEEKKTTRLRGIEFIKEHGQAKFLEQATPKLFSEVFKNENPEIIQEVIQRFTNFQDSALVHYYEAMMQRPDRTHVLKTYSGPIIFIMGEHDTAIPLVDGLQQCHMPHLSYIHLLRNSGHMGMIEETDKCREILLKFLKDL